MLLIQRLIPGLQKINYETQESLERAALFWIDFLGTHINKQLDH